MWEWLVNVVRQWVLAMAYTWDKPELFGTFHIGMSIGMIFAAWMAAHLCRNTAQAGKEKILNILGIILLVSEVWKQLFCYFVINGEVYNWWYFPFQLCSVPMYLCIVLPWCREKRPIERFLGGYGMIAALCALVFPVDMLRPYVLLTFHGFLWHGIMIYMAFLCLSMKGIYEIPAYRSGLLLLVLAAVAECFNILGTAMAVKPSFRPDLFYISPYTTSTQPVFRDIAVLFGRPVQIAVYLGMLSLAAWLVIQAGRKCVCR